MPTTVMHGAYYRESPFDVIQHLYGSTDCEADRQGYAEVLQITNPPPEKHGVVIHVFWNDRGSLYFEFTGVEEACHAFRTCRSMERKEVSKQPGYIGSLFTGEQSPWFYL